MSARVSSQAAISSSAMSIAATRFAPVGFVFTVFTCACSSTAPGSIGAVLSSDNETGALHVRDVSPGLSAERAGLVPGDEVVMIDGRLARDLDASLIRKALRGDVGTTVRLTIVRGDQVLRVKLARDELREPGEVKPKVETIAE